VPIEDDAGKSLGAAIAFTINAAQPSYCGDLPEEAIAVSHGNILLPDRQLSYAEVLKAYYGSARGEAISTRCSGVSARRESCRRTGSSDRTAQPGNTASSADLSTRLGGLDTRIDILENRLAQATDKNVQRDVQERLARLESDSSPEGMRRAASAVGFATLVRAAREAQSFKEELDAVSALAPADPSVSALGPYAAQGVPTFAMLMARFPEAARAALDAERTSNSGTGILARLWTRLAGLVRVRRVGDVSGNSSVDHLARAEADLGRADLAGATGETRALTGAAASAMASWLKDAEARMVVDRALALVAMPRSLSRVCISRRRVS
jgi:hypothetical protein